MDQSRGNTGQPTTPWWYRIPKHPFAAAIAFIVSIVIYTWGSQSVIASVVGGAVTAGIAEFVHGMAQAAYDERHRRVD